jgi:murein DD-endopeptidase MepM/ murein hydrolase activator NlpD
MLLCVEFHNVIESVGDVIKSNQVIAKVGRTGLNAYKKRSPTHLHFMVLKLNSNYYPQPINRVCSLTIKPNEIRY